MMTGLIFAVIAVLWVAYLVPGASHNEKKSAIGLDAESFSSFNRSTRLIRDSSTENVDSGYAVSTPLTRRAVRYEIWRAKKVGNRRRRRGLVLNFLILIATIVLPFFLPISHWLTAGGVALFVAWICLSRYSVKAMDRASKRWLEDSAVADDVEDTVVIDLSDQAPTELKLDDKSIELSLTDTIGSLMDPLPVTPSTYVSKPLLPRSVRTIDLTAPIFPQRPVTNEESEQADDEETRQIKRDGQSSVIEFPKAVGE